MEIILGGTHGLGKNIAQLLRADGHDVFVAGRSYDAAADGNGMKVDLADAQSVAALTKFVQSADNLTGFYWLAGYGYSGDFASQKEVGEMIAVNFANVVPIAQAVWQKFVAKPTSTHFVVVSSTSGNKPRSNEAVYSATKHAQVGLARSLGLESERLKSKVKVALFLPGGMRTPFWDGKRPDGYEAFLDPAKVAARVVARTRDQSDYFLEDRIVRGIL